MNIHPLLVHFPIGILVLYSIFELVSFRFTERLPYWFYVKAILAISGGALIYITAATGEAAEEIVTQKKPELRPLIETHSSFAYTTILVFTIIAICYLAAWLDRSYGENLFSNKTLKSIWLLTRKVKNLVIETKAVMVFALIGLVLLTITGALGASIVYGPDIDPFVKIIYSLVVRG